MQIHTRLMINPYTFGDDETAPTEFAQFAGDLRVGVPVRHEVHLPSDAGDARVWVETYVPNAAAFDAVDVAQLAAVLAFPVTDEQMAAARRPYEPEARRVLQWLTDRGRLLPAGEASYFALDTAVAEIGGQPDGHGDAGRAQSPAPDALSTGQ